MWTSQHTEEREIDTGSKHKGNQNQKIRVSGVRNRVTSMRESVRERERIKLGETEKKKHPTEQGDQ